ncbi:glycosyltransferase family 4 protein [Levilactobacillus brevis]|uniref:glycosyltransferase family 4 protein n=1 Tax=Levilactobacillus brevis TaxID=1580 RepID=UPI002277731C|nr:glycosyltransferase family 4 protein [Levilactobacillus brevis]WAE44399.1 glycosyltransferase family 4 protein [Levilactobacillus brevis]
MKELIVLTADSNGAYPVPAVRGGAVSTLVEHLVQDNERTHVYSLQVISFFDRQAEIKSRNYKNTHFVWIRVPYVFKILDLILFEFIKIFFPRKKNLSYRSAFSLLYYIGKVRSLIKKKSDDVLIENNIPLSLVFKKMNYAGNYYYHLHNVPRINAGCRDVLNAAAGFLCVSDYVRKEIMSEKNPIGPIRRDKVWIFKNCIDLSIFNDIENKKENEKLKQSMGISNMDRILLFTGRISQEKGVDQLIRAVRLLPKHYCFRLLIVGSYLHGERVTDTFIDDLKYLSRPINDKVNFVGFIEQNEIKKYYQIADIAILPSIWNEPAGLTMLEAMACGTPVITTNARGIGEYVENKAIVLERNKNLVQKIKTNIESLLVDESIRNKYATQGKKFVQEKYSDRDYTKRLQEFIK